MNAEPARSLLLAIITRERADGCPMADEMLIEPALRRWRSYERRFPRHRDRSLDHRAHDLAKGLIELFRDGGYDPGCIRHLARSFAEALAGEIDHDRAASHTAPSPTEAETQSDGDSV